MNEEKKNSKTRKIQNEIEIQKIEIPFRNDSLNLTYI